MTPQHPSVRALLEAQGGDDPRRAIRIRAQTLVAEALGLHWPGPPFDMTELASLRGLKVAPSVALTEDQDACVMPGQILVNGHKPLVRQRYSIAHEVAHTLFPDYEAELRREGRLWRHNTDDTELERLCQIGASELLFPLAAFRERVARRGESLTGVLAMALEFDASIEATARRLVDTAADPMVVVFLRPVDEHGGGWLPIDETDGHRPGAPLGVSLVVPNDACGKLSVPSGAVPPANGSAVRAWKRVALGRGCVVVQQVPHERWNCGDLGGLWDGEAITLPRGRATPHEVLCLLRRVEHS